MKHLRFVTTLIAVVAMSTVLVAGTATQKVMTMSPTLGKEMYYWVYLPSNYQQQAQAGKKFAVVYLLHQYSYYAAMWHTKIGALPNPEAHKAVDSVPGIICVAPDDGLQGKSWWMDSPTGTQGSQLTTFLIRDLKNAIDSAYATNKGREYTGLCGVSMGGYGTLHNLRIHPEIYSAGYAVVACTDMKKYHGWNQFDIPTVMPTYNAAFDILPNAASYKSLNVKLSFYTTEGDFFKDGNISFDSALTKASVTHGYSLLSGAHEPPTAERMVMILKFFQQSFPQFIPSAVRIPEAVSRKQSLTAGKNRRFVQIHDGSVGGRLETGLDGRVRATAPAPGVVVELDPQR